MQSFGLKKFLKKSLRKKMNKHLGIRFNEIAKINGDKIALRFSLKEKYTFGDLNILSEKFLNFFQLINLKSNDCILIESSKNLYSYVLIISCLKFGISYSFIDISQAPSRIEKIIKKTKPKKIFLFTSKLKLKKSIHLSKEKIKRIIDRPIIKKFVIKNKNPKIAYIMFTSGSTGVPKGVKISHSNLLYLIKWSKKFFNIDDKKVFTNLNPLHFDNSIFDFYCSLFNLASLIPIQKNEILYFNKLISKLNILKCNIWFSVPSLLNLILNLNNPSIFKKLKVKNFIFGGEPFPLISARKIFKYNTNIQFFNVSGPTECTCICSAYRVKKKELLNDQNLYVGKINSYFNYKITNINKEKNIGELYLEGPAISQGYVNDKLKTKEKFYKTRNFFGYKTGDIVKEYKNKLIKIIGRSDNQVKISGHRIELEEIENTINKIFNLSQSLVVLKNKKTFPYKKLILITNSKKLNLNSINKKLPKFLPNYMTPEEVTYTKNFKLNSNGKIDRKFYG